MRGARCCYGYVRSYWYVCTTKGLGEAVALLSKRGRGLLQGGTGQNKLIIDNSRDRPSVVNAKRPRSTSGPGLCVFRSAPTLIAPLSIIHFQLSINEWWESGRTHRARQTTASTKNDKGEVMPPAGYPAGGSGTPALGRRYPPWVGSAGRTRPGCRTPAPA